MRNTPYNIGSSKSYGEMAAWLRDNGEDNENDVRRLKRNLRLAREQELTPRQRQLMQMRFEQNMSVTEIADALGLDKSTVSRTITRAKQRLYRCLRYCL